MIEIEINARELQARIEQAAAKLENMRPLMQRIAGTLEHETEANFAAQGRPSWAPLSKATIAKRLKRNNGGSTLKILQDRGILASSSSDHAHLRKAFARLVLPSPHISHYIPDLSHQSVFKYLTWSHPARNTATTGLTR
jgi:hypothetical protein